MLLGTVKPCTQVIKSMSHTINPRDSASRNKKKEHEPRTNDKKLEQGSRFKYSNKPTNYFKKINEVYPEVRT